MQYYVGRTLERDMSHKRRMNEWYERKEKVKGKLPKRCRIRMQKSKAENLQPQKGKKKKIMCGTHLNSFICNYA